MTSPHTRQQRKNGSPPHCVALSVIVFDPIYLAVLKFVMCSVTGWTEKRQGHLNKCVMLTVEYWNLTLGVKIKDFTVWVVLIFSGLSFLGFVFIVMWRLRRY